MWIIKIRQQIFTVIRSKYYKETTRIDWSKFLFETYQVGKSVCVTVIQPKGSSVLVL